MRKKELWRNSRVETDSIMCRLMGPRDKPEKTRTKKLTQNKQTMRRGKLIYIYIHIQLFAKILNPCYISVYTYMECIVGRF